MKNPALLFLTFGHREWFNWLSDERYLKIAYWARMHKKLNLDNPQTFSEKLQWLKLYNRQPIYTKLVDKYEVKPIVANVIGEEYIIPTLGVWDKFEEIDFEKLPNRFVLKCTHDSGGLIVVKDKSKLNIKKARKKINKCLAHSFYWGMREWPYKNVKPRIIAEQFMEDDGCPGDLADYKFFCFDGEPKYCQVIRNRSTKETIDIYDMDWQLMSFVGLNPVAQNGLTPVVRPEHLDKMIEICRALSKGMPFGRVDLYVINGKEYFGEITFFPMSGFGSFRPDEYNVLLGKMLELPGQRMGGVIVEYADTITVRMITPELKDYKFFCFNGKVKCFKIDFGRFTDHHANYYTPEGELLPFGEIQYPPIPEHREIIPSNLQEMISKAELLSTNHPFVRVDFYNVKGKIYFGEMTFFPATGMGKFTDESWDERLGSWINLSNI